MADHPEWRSLRGRYSTRWCKTAVLVSIGYFLGAQSAFFVGTLSDRIFAPFWPPNVVLFCALLLSPARFWWLFIAACFPAHVVAEVEVGMGTGQLLVAYATNCMVALLSAHGVKRVLGEPPFLDDFGKALLFILITAVFSPGVSALGGAFVRIAGGGELDNYLAFWGQWYAANALASLTLGPAFLSCVAQEGYIELGLRRTQIEALLVGVGLVGVCFVAFRLSSLIDTRGFLPALLYSPMPLILWAAVRFGAKGASLAILVVTVTSIWLALNGPTIFVSADAEANVLALQLFLTGLAVPTLLLGAAIDGWRRAEHTTCELARYLLRTHDHERRQLATELHDGIAQDLVAARWLAERDCTSGSQSEHAAGKRLEAILQKSIGDLRATSYLLHPPLLDQAGLEAALRSFVLEHGARAGQRIDLAISSSLGRQSPEVELAVFRLVQDALAHGDLHPGSNHAYSRIQLNQVGGEILLTIEKQHPNGEGRTLLSTMQRFVPTRGARAVKLAGMRERLRQIGGRFEVHSRIGTTVIRAVIPHRPKMREF